MHLYACVSVSRSLWYSNAPSQERMPAASMHVSASLWYSNEPSEAHMPAANNACQQLVCMRQHVALLIESSLIE